MNDSRTVTFPVADTTRIVRCFVRPDGKNDTEELWTPAMDETDGGIVDELEDPTQSATEQPSGSESPGEADPTETPSSSEGSAPSSGTETESDSGTPTSSESGEPTADSGF